VPVINRLSLSLSVILVFCLFGTGFIYFNSKVQATVQIPKPKNSTLNLVLPKPNHIVIVVEENHNYKKIIGNSSAPYMNSLVKKGLLFRQSYGVTHPSQPNYLALFS
jgi:phosphatidylinositol-3-phosphatase